MVETRQSWNEIIWFQRKQKGLIHNGLNPTEKSIREIYWSIAPLFASSSHICVLGSRLTSISSLLGMLQNCNEKKN